MASGGHTVFVLGAGASLSEALDRRPRRSKEHPPLDANFFRRVAKYRRNPLFNRVQAQAAKLGIDDLTRTDQPVSLEDYLGRLYFNVQHNPIAASTSAYFDLIDLYAREVLATTQWMIGKGGLIKRVLQHELATGDDVSIVTFNIDLLIENSLEKLINARPGAPWALKTAYGFSDPLKRAQGSGEPFSYFGDTTIPLYKMHGSSNWVFKTRGYYPPGDLVGKSREVWQVLDRILPTNRMKLRAGGRGGRSVWYAFPLIVPPIYEKHAFIRMHLQEVWDGAEEALATADKVVFWGYSFPVADTHARQFFQGLADRNPVLRSPVVINPDPTVGQAIWTLLGADRVTQYRDATGYSDAA